jgi:HEAT repeat protein
MSAELSSIMTGQEAARRNRANTMTDLEPDERVKKLISEFRTEDGMKRLRARLSLVSVGKSIVPFTSEYLEDEDEQVRWEIAKTLEELKNPAAAPSLVRLLMDEAPGIRWLAAEGLVTLREHGFIPLLKGLQVNFHSTLFREAALHVLRELDRQDLLGENGIKILKILESSAPAVSVPFAATEVLHALQKS